MNLKHFSLMIIAVGALLLTDCKKDKPDDKPEEEEVFYTGLEFTDEETYGLIPNSSVSLFTGPFDKVFELDLPPPENQYSRNSCVSFAVAYGVMGYYIGKELGGFRNGDSSVNYNRVGSPEFLYNQTYWILCGNGSFIAQFVAIDNGLGLRKGALDVLKEYGVCTWNTMPYNSNSNCNIPDNEQFTDAKNYKISKYEKVKDLSQQNIKSLLVQGYPIIVGCKVRDELVDIGSNIFDIKYKGDKGHAMVIMGYNDNKGAYKLLNSWGQYKGDKGYIWMAYNDASKLIQQAYIVYPDIKKLVTTKPTLTTTTVTNITKNTAQSGGNITSDGGASVTARGICWNTSANPTINHNKTTDGTSTGSFTSNITGLQPNTTYYVKAYATNSAGTGYGTQVSFTTKSDVTITKPTVQTTSISSITQNSAQSGGNVTSDGGASVTERGIVWNTSANPTINHNKTTDGTGTGSYTSNITGLQSNTTYYVKAYATNSAGTGYGTQVSFKTTAVSASNPYLNPNLTYGSVTDIDGNKYATIKIGNQTWMAENLKVTRYNDGTPIPMLRDQDEWRYTNEGGRCYYDVDIANNNIYGTLYNWLAVETEKLCPKGWHIPTHNEWWELMDNLGGINAAGGKMKSTHNIWSSPNTGATNSSGFSALPGGRRESWFSQFENKNYYGNWWSSTISSEDGRNGPYFWWLSYDNNLLEFSNNKYVSGDNDKYGNSCRCIKD